MDKIFITVGTIIALALVTEILKILIAKIEEIKEKTDDTRVKGALDIAEDLIIKIVGATNQTFVKSLKDSDEFGEAQAKEAFNKTLSNVKDLLDAKSKETLEKVYGDLDKYLENAIENEVRKQKELI